MLAGLVVLFLGAFWLQRQRSSFLAIERDRAAAAAVAARHGVSLAEAMALRDLIGADAAAERWHEVAAIYAAERPRLGEPLAAVAAAGGRAAAEAALRAAGDPERAWSAFRLDAMAVPGLRFLALRERFAARKSLRD